MYLPVLNIESSCRNLKRICEERGYSAASLQKALGLESSQACYKWFAGKNLPNIDNLIAISRLLDVRLEEILVTDDRDLELQTY